jgi:translation initiation factor 4G
MSHPQPVPPPPVLQQPPATPSPASPKDETSPFVRPKKSSAIRIVNPDTKAEVTFTKVAPAVKVPERSPSPAVKSTPAKPVPRVTHPPAPSLDVERPASAQKSKEELKEEMKAKIASALVKEQAKKEEAERLDREKKMEEERKAKEEAERVEKERKEEEERKRKVEEERIKREQEEAERKAEEERVAAQKAKEEEDARIAEEKAKEEAAAEAARLAKEKEEAETKAKEEAESKVREEAKAKAREEAEAAAAAAAALTVSVEDMSLEERRPSLSGTRKTAPPPIAITSDTSIPDGLQSAALKTASFIKQDDFLTTKYPNGFTSPEPAINAKFSPKGFHYNVEFLAQFKDVYRDKPSSDWDSRIKETMGKIDNRQQRPGLGGAPRTVSASGGFPHQTMGTFGVGLNTKPGARPPSVLPSLATGGYNPINQPFPPRPPRQQSTSGQGMQS